MDPTISPQAQTAFGHGPGSPMSPFAVPGSYHSRLIPSGTVASRIGRLQQAVESPLLQKPPGRVARNRAGSGANFGKRKSPKFHQPAQRPRYIVQEFKGLRNEETGPQANRLQARVRPRGLDSSSLQAGPVIRTIFGSTRSQGNLQEQVQHSRSETLKESKSVAHLNEAFSPPHQQHPKEAHHQSPPDRARRRSQQRTEQWRQDLLGHQMEEQSYRHNNPEAWPSMDTTSSSRRHSVQEMFNEYGVDTPHGLLFSAQATEHIETLPPNHHKFCHNCRWINDITANKCWRCSHRLCDECDWMSPRGRTTGGGITSAMNREHSRHHSNKIGVSDNVTESNTHETLEKAMGEARKALPAWSNHRLSTQIYSSHVVSLNPKEDFHVDQQLEPSDKQIESSSGSSGIHEPFLKKSRDALTRQDETDAEAARVQVLPEKELFYVVSPRKTKSFVRDNPFLLADSKAPLFRLQSNKLTIDHQQHKHGRLAHHKPSYRDLQNTHYSEDSDIEQAITPITPASHVTCDDLGCRATHDGHSPYRHSSICTKRRMFTTPIENNDPQENHERLPDHFIPNQSDEVESQPNRGYIRQSHRVEARQPVCSNYQKGSPRFVDSPFIAQEYIECHGYPRTGHDTSRQGSVTGDTVVGQCQHCLNDCQCSACQNSQHNVRCCVHESHNPQILAHRHPINHEIPAVPAKARFLSPDLQKLPKATTSPSLARTEEMEDLPRETPLQASLRNRRKTAMRKKSKAVLQHIPSFAPTSSPSRSSQVRRSGTGAGEQFQSSPEQPIHTTRQQSAAVVAPTPRKISHGPSWIATSSVGLSNPPGGPSDFQDPGLVKQKTLNLERGISDNNGDKLLGTIKEATVLQRQQISDNSLLAKYESNAVVLGNRENSLAASTPAQIPLLQAPSPATIELSEPSRPASLGQSKTSQKTLTRQHTSHNNSVKYCYDSPTKSTTPLLDHKLEVEKEIRSSEEDMQTVIEMQKDKGRTWGTKLVSPTSKSKAETRNKAVFRKESKLDLKDKTKDKREVTTFSRTVIHREGQHRAHEDKIIERTDITGISVVIHREGKEDLIIETGFVAD